MTRKTVHLQRQRKNDPGGAAYHAAPLVFYGGDRDEEMLKLLTAGILLIIGWTDYKTMEIPDIWNAALGICAFASLFMETGISIGERIGGAVCVSLPMYLLCVWIHGAFGEGDMLLLSVMGFYLGMRLLLLGAFLGFLLGGAEAVYLLGTRRVKPGEHARMAFAPALCAGLLTAMFFGERILSWYFGLFYG